MYDFTIASALEWPTLSLQWLPGSETSASNGPNFSTYKLLLGSHTGKRAQDYLNIVGVDIPTKPISGAASTKPKLNLVKKILNAYPGKTESSGEVNVAKYNPFAPSTFASIANSGDVLLFDCTGKTETRALQFHTKPGYALDWNSKVSGLLATGSEDATIAVWDINAASPTPKYSLPTTHSANVTAVEWSPHMPTVLASVSDDGNIVFSDTRSSDFGVPVIQVENAHSHPDGQNGSDSEHDSSSYEKSKKDSGKDSSGEADKETDDKAEKASASSSKYTAINDISFNPFNEYILATASSDKTAALWDLRRMDQSIHSLVGHSAAVTSLQWSPHTESVLATAGYDRRVMIWDLSRIDPTEQHDDEDGPPELLFVHGGHTSKISQFAWHPEQPWVIASAGEDNIVQVWKPAANIVNFEEERDEEEEENEDQEMEDADEGEKKE